MKVLMQDAIKFSLSEILGFQAEALTQCVANMVERLFSDPTEEGRFQKWKKERAVKAAGKEE